jgi:hypothetical protein
MPEARDYTTRTREAHGRRKNRPSGKSQVLVRMDEWIFDWVKSEAVSKKRTLSSQIEMVLARTIDGRIK